MQKLALYTAVHIGCSVYKKKMVFLVEIISARAQPLIARCADQRLIPHPETALQNERLSIRELVLRLYRIQARTILGWQSQVLLLLYWRAWKSYLESLRH